VFSWSPLGGPRRLSDTPYRAANAVWSPDGQRMAFTSEREDGRSDIFVMRIPASTRMPEAEQISDGNIRYTYLSPQWAADGRSIFYIATDTRLIDSLRVFDLQAGEERPLTTFNGVDYYDALSISPDGEQIAFASQRDGNWEIYVMEIDGSNVRRLTSNRADDRDPAWSPDGTQIAFVSARDGFLEVYVTDTAGSALRQLTDSSENKRKPVWSPDGSYIVFNGTIDGEAGNFLVSVTAGTDSEPFRLSGDSTDAVSDWQLTHQ
ncbi:MAG: PD40 domain-containing protein, partial [Burkholderiales bacterium]|nr:PD40 domain-containing protein [Anaerolineae bacterium]